MMHGTQKRATKKCTEPRSNYLDIGMHLLIRLHAQLHNGQLVIRAIIQQRRDILEGALMLRDRPRIVETMEAGFGI
jgi:hypothetical protein